MAWSRKHSRSLAAALPPAPPVTPSKLPAQFRRVLLNLWLRNYRALYEAVGKGEPLVRTRKTTTFEYEKGAEAPVRKTVTVHEIVEETPTLADRKAFGDVLMLYGLGQLRESWTAQGVLTPPTAAGGGEPVMPPLVFWRPAEPGALATEPIPKDTDNPKARASTAAKRPKLSAEEIKTRAARALKTAQEQLDKTARSRNIGRSDSPTGVEPDAAPSASRADRGRPKP